MFDLPPHLHLVMERSPTASATVRSALRTLNPDALEVSRFPDVLLATSELVSNAVQYSTGKIIVSAWCELGSCWRVEVGDDSPLLPNLDLEAASSPMIGGHGLRIVDSVVSSWGVLRTDKGKCSWFELQT